MKWIYSALGLLAIAIAVGYYFFPAIRSFYYWLNPMAQSPDTQHVYYLPNEPMENREKQIYVALGDSLTAGVGVDKYEQSYPYLVASFLSRKNNVDLIDEAVPGYTSADLVNRLLDKAISDKPDIVTVLVGTNDILQNVSSADFEKNYTTILNRLKNESRAQIFTISIPYVGDDQLFLPPYNDQIDQKVKSFNSVLKKLAPQYGAIYVDIYTPTAVKYKKSGPYYSADHFHPSAQGYAEWANIIYDNINL